MQIPDSPKGDSPTSVDWLKYFFVKTPPLAEWPEWPRALIAVAALSFGLLFVISTGLAIVLLFSLAEDALTLPPPGGLDAARTFLAAFVGAFGAPFLIWRTWVAHRQAKTAAEQARVALENRFTGIFSDAVKLLGEIRDVRKVTSDGVEKIETVPNIEARIGALFSLERLLRESEKDQAAILETICAYVRENSPLSLPDDEEVYREFLRGESVVQKTKRADAQVALDIIGRRPIEVRERGIRERWSLDLSNANLIGYRFEGTRLRRREVLGIVSYPIEDARCEFSLLRIQQLASSMGGPYRCLL